MSTVTLRVGPADHGRAMTAEEFEEADEEPGYRYELGRGVLEVTQKFEAAEEEPGYCYELSGGSLEATPIPGEPHGLIVWEFMKRISSYHALTPGVIFLAGGSSEFRHWIAEMDSARHPDVSVAFREDRPSPPLRCRPALVMEVVSAGAEAHERDYVTKRREYLAYGMREYWIVDRFDRIVTVLSRDGDEWAERVFGDGEEARGSVLNGFSVVVNELWDAAEQSADED